MSDANYTLQMPGTFVDKLAFKKRKKMYDIIAKELFHDANDIILDVGVTADRELMASNYIEMFYPHKNKLIALSDQNAAFLEDLYPGLTFKRGDARALPFSDESVDIVVSSAVIEHVGSYEKQKKMLMECVRVAKKSVAITTPNRWHPVDPHTLLPIIHWLPKHRHRWVLKKLGMNLFALEENLNLLDKKILTSMCEELNIKNFYFKSIRTWGWVSNLILFIIK